MKILFPNARSAFEFMKMEIKNFSIEFSTNKSREQKKSMKIAEKKLEILETIPPDKLNNETTNLITSLRAQLQDSMSSQLKKGHHIRSKIPHFEEGEGDISYFTRLEKRKGEENAIFSLERENGEVVEGTEEVLKLAHSFYQNL